MEKTLPAVEVNQAMISAGIQALRQFGVDFEGTSLEAIVVTEIFTAMENKRAAQYETETIARRDDDLE